MSAHTQRRREEHRNAVFRALRELLLEHPWADVTLESVATRAGVSRQTLYNAFGSRYGLAEAYTLDLADAFCDVFDAVLQEHRGEPRRGLTAAQRTFLEAVAADPVVRRVPEGVAHDDLVRTVTSDAGPLLALITGRLAASVADAWGWTPQRARSIARVIARLSVSYVITPPEDGQDAADEMAAVLTPE